MVVHNGGGAPRFDSQALNRLSASIPSQYRHLLGPTYTSESQAALNEWTSKGYSLEPGPGLAVVNYQQVTQNPLGNLFSMTIPKTGGRPAGPMQTYNKPIYGPVGGPSSGSSSSEPSREPSAEQKDAYNRTSTYLAGREEKDNHRLRSYSPPQFSFTSGNAPSTSGNAPSDVMSFAQQYDKYGREYTAALKSQAETSSLQNSHFLYGLAQNLPQAPKTMSPEDQLKYAKMAYDIGSGKSA